MKILKYKRIFFLAAAPLAYLLSYLAALRPDVTDRVYSRNIYPTLSGILGRITGWLPFSLTEILLYILVITITVYFLYQIRMFIPGSGSRKKRLIKVVLNVLVALSVWYAIFMLLCGLNYHRLTFTNHSGLFVRDSSVDELAALCGELVSQANDLREFVALDDDGVMVSSFSSHYQCAAYAGEAFENLADHYPILKGYAPRPKPVLMSRMMSYLNITGIYVPFTFEANVNIDTVDYNIPSSMMHELAHFKGFMREDEANFISYLACSASGHADFEYSGTLLALIHTSNALRSSDQDIYREIMGPLSEGVWADFAANRAYWRQFEGPVSEVSTAVNNTYLRVNRQSDGVKSYGRMVDLLLADYRLRHGLV
ncbi:MAG: DUF3810 domain-containing protein [Oscillospiraceae bacterium]|jgi:hypothetical protein|nr:DUF3810 domain-containing protein [Oscillospiraceae bacterium]